MTHHIKCKWINNLSVDALVNNHHLVMDADSLMGGQESGPRPKQILLAALAGCTGISVVSLLNKMQVPFSDFNIDVDAELTHEHPKVYTSFHITYSIKVDESDREKMHKAIKLSDERYCGVSAMFRHFASVSHQTIFI